jgi:hypothetical protein
MVLCLKSDLRHFNDMLQCNPTTYYWQYLTVFMRIMACYPTPAAAAVAAAAAACRGGVGQQGLEGGSAGQAGRASTHLSLRASQVP